MLQRSIGKFGLLFAALGGMIGSGWLFGPFFAARVAGPASVVAWILGGALVALIALTFAELASTFPVAGGTVRFIQMSHGPLVSFTMAWVGWLSAAAVAPIETMAALQYSTNYLPWLMHDVNNVHVLSLSGFFVAAAIMFIMCVINAMGAHFLSKTNNLVVVLKVSGVCLTIFVLSLVAVHAHNWVSFQFAPFGLKGILSALPTAGVIFSFIGFTPAVQLAGEAKNPQFSVPFALIGALIMAIIIYVLLQYVFIGSLNSSDVANGWQRLNFPGDAGPFVGIFTRLGIIWMAFIIYLNAIVSPFGTALIYTASSARICYGMGENGYLPKPLMKLNRFHVPMRIIILNFIIGIFLFLPFPSWQKLVSFLVSALVLSYAVGPLSLFILRKKLPHQPRPFRVPMPRLMGLSAFYICNLIVYWAGWGTVSKILIAMIIGYLVLIIYRQTKEGKKLNFQWEKAWWIFIYMGSLGLISFLGSFGSGKNILPFGWDFLVMAIITIIIFELSQFCALREGRKN